MSATPPSGVRGHSDVVVIGAGLGGMSTALRLLRMGLSVTVLERSGRVGGLCGVWEHEGLPYLVACHEFGRGALQDLQELGVRHPFTPTAMRVLHEERAYLMPPNLGTLLRLGVRLPSLWRCARALQDARRGPGARFASLAEVTAGCKAPASTADLVMLPSFLRGVAPDRFPLDLLDDEFRFGYGYMQPVTPAGGPQALADAMARQVVERGGRILLNCEFDQVDHRVHQKIVRTSQGRMSCEILVSTLPQWGTPSTAGHGLPVSMYWLKVDGDFEMPKGVSTHVHYPSGVAEWMGELEAGRLPPRFGFKVVRADLPARTGCYTANVVFYLPRGLEEDPETQQQAKSYIRDHLDDLLPELRNHVLEATLVTPTGFASRLGSDAVVTPVLRCPPGQGRAAPGNYCPATDTHYAGALSYPGGLHAGAALRSSAYVQRQVAQHVFRRHRAAA